MSRVVVFFFLHLFDESSLTRPAFLPCKWQNWLTMPVSFIITARQLVTATNTSVLISYRTYNGMYNISYVKVVCLYTYNRIYTVILLEKKKNFPNTPWSNCYSKYCVRPKGHTHPLDNTCTPASLCTVYQMYNLLALSYQNLKGALSPWFIYLYIIVRELWP